VELTNYERIGLTSRTKVDLVFRMVELLVETWFIDLKENQMRSNSPEKRNF
jgi:hypothetical protein